MEEQSAVPFVLDTAGRLWPILRTARLTSLFRLAVEFRDAVDLPALERSLMDLKRRYPGFFVRIRHGVFWSYVEPGPERLPLFAEDPRPCMNWSAADQARGLIRVRPWRNRIAVEFSHAVTDGGGAVVFMRALAQSYCRYAGIGAVPGQTEEHPGPGPEEWENAFWRHTQGNLPSLDRTGRAYRPRSGLLPRGRYRLLVGTVSSQHLRDAAAAHDVKVGEYLVAVLADALQTLSRDAPRGRRPGRGRRRLRRPIRILVPVDLRRFFPSRTLRNFFAFVAPELDQRLGAMSFDEIAHEVKWQMRGGLTRRRLLAHFSQHVGLERTLLLRVLPRLLKRVIVGLGFPVVGEGRYSASLSNLGPISLPEGVSEEVIRFLFSPPPSPWTRTNCSVVSYGGETVITFGSTAVERDIEREFFRTLRRQVGPLAVWGGSD